MRINKKIGLAGMVAIFILSQTLNTGCTKPQEIALIDTIIIPPPPPVPQDTVSLVRKLDVLTSLYPSYNIVPERSYSFYYDNQKRVTSIGIKIYPLFTTDTFTVQFAYSGASKVPYRGIIPYVSGFSAPTYDTIWFFYNPDGRLQKDSISERFYGTNTRTPFYRLYTYPDAQTGKIDWFWPNTVVENPVLRRRDTVRVNANGLPEFIKAVYPTDPVTAVGSYAKAEGFTFSQIVNPLSKLNISGTPYSLIYTDVKDELLGNSSHPLVYNSNGFATYLDFISPQIPNLFYISGYNSYHQIIGQGGAGFPIDITPWSVRPSYPAEIRVRISTSLAGDKYIYRYNY